MSPPDPDEVETTRPVRCRVVTNTTINLFGTKAAVEERAKSMTALDVLSHGYDQEEHVEDAEAQDP